MKVIHALFISIFLLVVPAADLHAQGEIDQENKILFRNEKTYGLTLNTNGWGGGYRYAKRINARKKWLFEGSVNYIKHPKERKEFNYYSYSLSRFVYGKTNLAVNMRLGAGRQNELFEKFDKNSISVRFVWTAGVSAAFLKPVYYKILEGEYFVVKKYEAGVPFFYILERASFFKGMNEIRVIPGGYARVGMSFDFSKDDRKMKVLETGVFAALYADRIKIMANDMNQFFLPGVYLSFRFGKVESSYHIQE